MTSSIQRGADSGLGRLLRSAATSLNRRVSRSFSAELNAASGSKTDTRSEAMPERARQILNTTTSTRPNVGDREPARPRTPAAPATQTPTPAAAPRAESGPSENAAVIALRDALTTAGLNTAGMEFEYVDQTVGYPGGSYQNRLITVTLPGGVKENFGADLVLRNPRITVVEIQNLMRRPIAT